MKVVPAVCPWCQAASKAASAATLENTLTPAHVPSCPETEGTNCLASPSNMYWGKCSYAKLRVRNA